MASKLSKMFSGVLNGFSAPPAIKNSPVSLGNLATREVANMFNQAFFGTIGGGYTHYDSSGVNYIEKGYNENADVYAVVSQISRKFASVPKIVKRGETEITDPLIKPNYYQTEVAFRELWETFMLCTGNAYQWMITPSEGANAGKPLGRFLLPSHLMKIVLKPDAGALQLDNPVDYYMLVIGAFWIKFDAQDVIHSKFPNPNYDMQGSHLYGQSPLRAGLKNVQSSNQMNDNNIKTAANGGVYGFIHASDGDTPLTQDQADDIKGRLTEMQISDLPLGRIQGASGSLDFTKISIDPDKLLPFEFLSYDKAQICNVLGWSTLLLNDSEGAKYDNLDAVWRMSISNRIQPDLLIYQNDLNEQYYPRFKEPNVSVLFDVSEMPEMQTDMSKLVTWLSIAYKDGIITPNEYRAAIKYNEVPDPIMNMYYVSSGLKLLQDAGMSDPAENDPFKLIDDEPI